MWDVDADHMAAITGAPAPVKVPKGALPTAQPPNPSQLSTAEGRAEALMQLQQLALLTKKARYVHVGNVTPEVGEQHLRDLFNSALAEAAFTAGPGDAVLHVSCLPAKFAAFIEFRSPHECTNAVSLSGIEIGGKQLRISRTRDYEPAPPHLQKILIPQGLPAPTQALVATVNNIADSSTTGGLSHGRVFNGFEWTANDPSKAAQIKKQQNAHELTYTARRVYIGNLPTDGSFDNERLRAFVTTAMETAGINDTSKQGNMILSVHRDVSARWAFLEFRTVAEANSCLHLNGLSLGSRQLMINRTKDYTPVSDEMYPKLLEAGVIGSTVLSPEGRIVSTPGTTISGGLQSGAHGLQSHMAGGSGGPSLPGVPQFLMDNTRRVRKVFIGNLNASAGITAEVLSVFFTEAMNSAKLTDPDAKGDPIIWSYVDNRAATFGFIEFRSIAEANSCFALNGIEFQGRKLHVNRSREYAPVPEQLYTELSKHGLLGNTSISPDGKDVFGDSTPNPEEETGGQWKDLA